MGRDDKTEFTPAFWDHLRVHSWESCPAPNSTTSFAGVEQCLNMDQTRHGILDRDKFTPQMYTVKSGYTVFPFLEQRFQYVSRDSGMVSRRPVPTLGPADLWILPPPQHYRVSLLFLSVTTISRLYVDCL